jgi:hypothetical protein
MIGARLKVWVSIDSKGRMVYHCPKSRFYGKTKQGEYITLQKAILEGIRPSKTGKCKGLGQAK